MSTSLYIYIYITNKSARTELINRHPAPPTRYNYSLFSERGDDDNLDHRYEWGMQRLMEHEDFPHSIAISTQQCDEPNRILRSELMILLLLMWAKGRLSSHLYDQITPV